VFYEVETYPEEFKKRSGQASDRVGYSATEVAQQLSTTTHSLHVWIKKYGEP